MKNTLISILLASLAVVAVACGYSKLKEKQAMICDQEYALCTSAQCIPDPHNPDLSVCYCEMREGKSYGFTSCGQRTPKTDQFGSRHVISTFSFDDLSDKKNMTCPSGNPWSNCLDQPCIIDPLDSTKAMCMCKIVRTDAFQTFGGDCDTSTCETGYWSGATIESVAVSVKILMKALGLSESPQKFCPKGL